MAGTQNHGFDVAYEISKDRFFDILHDLFIDNLPLRLLNLPLSVPLAGGVVQTGSLSLPSFPSIGPPPTPPAVTLAINPPNGFVLTMNFAGSALTLNPVISALGTTLAPGVGPNADVGYTAVTLPLTIDTLTDTSNHRSPITISRTATPIGVAPPTGLANVVTAAVASALAGPIQDAVTRALQAAFPIIKNIQLPGQGPCDIFPRLMKMKLLPAPPAQPGMPQPSDAFGFFLALEQATLNSGDVSKFTNSALISGTDAALTVANTLLLDLACCLLPNSHAISGLTGTPQHVQDPTETCCRWSNLGSITIGSTTFDSAPLFQICIVNGGLAVNGHLKQSGFGWHADINFSLIVTLKNESGLITPVMGAPAVNVDAEVEWWVWLLALVPMIVGAIVGFLVGGPGVSGLIVGAIIGALISAPILIVLGMLQNFLNTTLGQSLGTLTGVLGSLAILPSDLVSLVGGLDLIGDPIVDDVRLPGRLIRPPALALHPSWTFVRGPIVRDTVAALAIKPGGGGNGGPVITEYQRAGTGVFTAVPRTLREPIRYQWKWSGANISGQGTLPGTTTSFNAAGNTCRLQTSMGEDLTGELAVAATDSLGVSRTASSRVAVNGVEIHFIATALHRAVHSVSPIEEQLVPAISHGMGVPSDSVQLR
jgi:hypothetical protein